MLLKTSTSTNKMRKTKAVYLKRQRLIAETHRQTHAQTHRHAQTHSEIHTE